MNVPWAYTLPLVSPRGTPGVIGRIRRVVAGGASGLATAVRARPLIFAAAAVSVVLLDIGLPPLVLSLARKAVDYFTFNAWLSRLPEFLADPKVPWRQKLEFIPNLALFWFSSDSPYGGTEWGFAVTVADLARFIAMGLLFGAYFALWSYGRAHLGGGWRAATTRDGGVAAALATVVGFSTGPCSVMGCGAPVMPVLGLAFAGLSSTTIAWMSELSSVATTAVFATMIAGVCYLAWRVREFSAMATSVVVQPER